MQKLTRIIQTVLAFLLLATTFGARSARAQTTNYFHTQGNQIVDANGRQVILTGINWFGLETSSYAPHGLWARNWESMLDQISELGFNTIRLPYSNQLFEPSSIPNGINIELNPDLDGLSGLLIMDKIIQGAGERGIRVILDRHRPDSGAQSELWYTPQYSEARWIQDWVMLAERYAGNDTVIGADLHNEPHGKATWGSGDPETDWRLAAERAGNAILQANPDLLIIVQGVDQYQGDWYWWGGNLIGAREYPVRLDVPQRLVYSTHVYGPGVYPQPWFWDATFPENLYGIWDRHFGYLNHEGTAPVVVGEFGGRSVGDDREGVWQRTLVSYLRENNLSYFYWTLNPNSGDTGGLLLDDWQTVDPDKQELLSGYQFSILGIEELGPEPASRLAIPETVQPQNLVLRYRTANPAPYARDSKPEFILANRGTAPVSLADVQIYYWLAENPGVPLVFHCDWAAVGCANVSGEFVDAGAAAQALRIRFGSRATVLAPGQETGEIKVRFHQADWSEFLQESHFSFASFTDFREWDRVSLYVGGSHVWGVLPIEGLTLADESATPGLESTPVSTAVPPNEEASPVPATQIATLQPTPAQVVSTPQTGQVEATFWRSGSILTVLVLAGFILGLGFSWSLKIFRKDGSV